MKTITPFLLLTLLACTNTGTKTTNKEAVTQPPARTTGITDKLLSAVNLDSEIAGMAGYRLRTRLITIEPGGATAIHNHTGRPGTVYILQGTITNHVYNVAKEYGPGPGWPEEKGVTHWIENKGKTPAVEISVDLFKQQ